MSDYVDYTDHKIKFTDFRKAWAAALKLKSEQPFPDLVDGADFDAEQCWEIVFEPTTGEPTINYTAEKYYSATKDMLERIAPYVEDGSWVEMSVANDTWRWYFEDGKLVAHDQLNLYRDQDVVEHLLKKFPEDVTLGAIRDGLTFKKSVEGS